MMREHSSIENAWDFIWNKFFDPRTCLIYDYLVGDSPDAATWHLPTPELIQAQIPNPSGNGTGMEDSMLSAGTMMDTIVARYTATNDISMKNYADNIYRGMELCATVSPKKGFITRSVSPIDRVSHYSNSSIDQYTHWIYGAYRLYFSKLADEMQRAGIRKCLTAVAEMCENDIIEENNWNILREDGKIGIVQKMWGDLPPHAFLRLPMIYLTAWKCTGDLHWRDMYYRYRDEAFKKTLPFKTGDGQTYIGLQLQYSLRLIWDLDDENDFKQKCISLMQRNASLYEVSAVKRGAKLVNPEKAGDLSYKYKPWNKVNSYYVGFYGGKAYFCPGQSEFAENTAFYPIRAVGEGIAIAALCPGYTVSEQALDTLEKLAFAIDYNNHYTYAPMSLFNAWWLAKESEAVSMHTI